MVRICAFGDCSNSTYTLFSRLTDDACQCPPPLTFHTFPIENRDLAARLKWAKAVYRKRTNGKNWLPSTDDRICSIHFIDGKPTAAHPYPTQNLGVNVVPQFSPETTKIETRTGATQHKCIETCRRCMSHAWQ